MWNTGLQSPGLCRRTENFLNIGSHTEAKRPLIAREIGYSKNSTTISEKILAVNTALVKPFKKQYGILNKLAWKKMGATKKMRNI